MLEETNLHFNEAELLNLIAKYETIVERRVPEGEWKEELKKAVEPFNKIWWGMKSDTEYYLFSEPF